jgi:hypothetical protein
MREHIIFHNTIYNTLKKQIIEGGGLGIGDWGLGPIPNPQSPIPNPQSHERNYISKLLLFS